jgi:hypothetical protein
MKYNLCVLLIYPIKTLDSDLITVGHYNSVLLTKYLALLDHCTFSYKLCLSGTHFKPGTKATQESWHSASSSTWKFEVVINDPQLHIQSQWKCAGASCLELDSHHWGVQKPRFSEDKWVDSPSPPVVRFPTSNNSAVSLEPP